MSKFDETVKKILEDRGMDPAEAPDAKPANKSVELRVEPSASGLPAVGLKFDIRNVWVQIILAAGAFLVCAGLAWSLFAGVSWVRVVHEKNKIEEQDKGGR